MIVVQNIARKCGFAFVLCCLMLLLAACDVGGISINGSATPTPTPTPEPSPTPTTAATQAATAAANLTTYTGNGYTIGYPASWTVNKGGSGNVTFSDPQGIAYMTVEAVPNPEGVISTDQQVNVGLQLFQSQAKNYQKQPIAPTTTLAGDTWSQGAATGDLTPKGQTDAVTVRVIVVSDNHPANSSSTQGFTIAYGTGDQVFSMANTTYFQPMLQSFKFS